MRNGAGLITTPTYTPGHEQYVLICFSSCIHRDLCTIFMNAFKDSMICNIKIIVTFVVKQKQPWKGIELRVLRGKNYRLKFLI